MPDEYNTALKTYMQKWQRLAAARSNKAFFEGLQPTAFGWKVSDTAEFDERAQVLRDMSEQAHLGWVNERWLATFYLNEPLENGVRLVKLMERRPGSTDAVGLDNVDFLLAENVDAKAVLAAEPDLQWTEEMNGDHCQWLSVWFDGTEAKLRRDTVLQVCVDEMLDCQGQLLSELAKDA